MKLERILIIPVLLLAGLLAACGADAVLGEICFATGVDDQGRPVAETTTFRPGETVYLSLELTGAYQGLESTATWKRGAETLATETVATPRAADALDPVYLVFQLQTGTDWPAGDYTCELFVPDQGITTLEYTLQ